MRTTAGRTTTTRALALAMVLAIPLLSACQPDRGAGLPEVSGNAGELHVLIGATGQGEHAGSSAEAQGQVLDAPGGVAVNEGVRYVADTGHQRVLRFTQGGTCVVMAGPQGPAAPFDWCMGERRSPLMLHPTAIAVDENSDVFVADPQAKRVFMTGPTTAGVITVAGNGQPGTPADGAQASATPLSSPTGLAVTRDGAQLYIADAGAHQVLVVDTSGLVGDAVPSPLRSGGPSLQTPPQPSQTSSAPTASGTGSPTPSAPSQASSTATGSASSPVDSTEGDPEYTPAADGAEHFAAVPVQSLDEESDGPAEAGRATPSSGATGAGDVGVQPSGSPSLTQSTAGRLFVVAGPGCAPGPGGRPVLGATVQALTAGLSSPSALVVAEGVESMPELYVADRSNHQVYAITIPFGSVDQPRDLTTVSSDDPALTEPVALAVGSRQGPVALVAADAKTHAVVVSDLGGHSLEWAPLTSELQAPSALAGDRMSVLVADSDADAVYGVPLEGTASSSSSRPSESSSSSDPSPSQVRLLSAGVPLAADRAEVTASSASASPSASAAACGATPTPTPTSTTTTTTTTTTTPVTGNRGTPDPDFTPRSSSGSSRPKVPGGTVVPDPGTHRFSGNDRVATSVDTSQKLFPKAGSVPVVVISSASSYADSAGGARYAAEKGGSLLLTPGKALDPAVEAEVRRSLAAGGSIVVTGREDAITPSVFSALEAIAPGRTERIGGVDRYETATKLAQRLADQMTTTATGPIYLVTGADYPDALVVVSLARRTGGLIVLSKDGVLPPVTKALLQQMDPMGARTVPVGGAAAAAAASLGGDAGRTASAAAVVGSDRYETARKVAERFVALDTAAGARTDVVGLATGTTWPDALVGSTAMGTLVGPLLLTHGDQLDPNVVKALAAIPSSRPSTTVVFGGESAVPASVMAAFGAAAKG